jgi:hypothetical protein
MMVGLLHSAIWALTVIAVAKIFAIAWVGVTELKRQAGEEG